MITFNNINPSEDLLEENYDFLARLLKDGINVHYISALTAALVGDETGVNNAIGQVASPFKKDAYLLSAFCAAKNNHGTLVFKLLNNVETQEHWDIAATAFCYGHSALAESIVTHRPNSTEDGFLLDSLIPAGLNTYSPAFNALLEQNRNLKQKIETHTLSKAHNRTRANSQI